MRRVRRGGGGGGSGGGGSAAAATRLRALPDNGAANVVRQLVPVAVASTGNGKHNSRRSSVVVSHTLGQAQYTHSHKVRCVVAMCTPQLDVVAR